MFGFLYAIGLSIGGVIHGVKSSIENSEFKQRGIERERRGENLTHTYMDRMGREFDVRTGRQCIVTYDVDSNDRIVKDLKTGVVLYNLTQEKKEKQFQKDKLKSPEGTRAIYYGYWDWQNTRLVDPNNKTNRYIGKIYRDINTGALYILRKITWDSEDMRFDSNYYNKNCTAEFYMDIKTAKLIDLTDDEKEYLNIHKIDLEPYYRFIEYFNKEQDNGGWIKKDSNIRFDTEFRRKYLISVFGIH